MNVASDLWLVSLNDVFSYVLLPIFLPLMNHRKIPASVCTSFELLLRLIDPSLLLSLFFPLQTHHCPPFSLFARL